MHMVLIKFHLRAEILDLVFAMPSHYFSAFFDDFYLVKFEAQLG